MKCILMNKNTKVLSAEYHSSLGVFTDVYDIYDIDFAPVILKNIYNKEENLKVILSNWFKGRGIPLWRDDLDLLLTKLNISAPTELLDKAFGLSLSDQYWIKPYDSRIEYKDINFFEHDFKDTEFIDATFSNNTETSTTISLISPNNTTDGRLKKTWIIDDNKRYLLKGGYKNEVLQPFNEVLASMISKRLGFNYVSYTLEIVKDKVVSKCECFINKNTELVSAYQILYNNCDKDNAYETYIDLLEKKGIKDARSSLENMFILDYIMLNEDRHLNNFGIIRNVETLDWIGTAPIFDTGESLNIIDYSDEEVIINGEGRFFYNINNFDDILDCIKDLKKYDLNKLDGICEEFDDLLHKYQPITKMTDRRINKICTLLFSRIIKLKKKIDSK
ncbi:MAG: excisionase [Bacilli bacterium]